MDPVCGMTVDPARAAGSFEYDGQTYYFCNQGCLRRFQADPEEFLKPREPESAVPVPGRHLHLPDASGGACSDAPGACPICGMALEPRTITAEETAESRAGRHDAAVLDCAPR